MGNATPDGTAVGPEPAPAPVPPDVAARIVRAVDRSPSTVVTLLDADMRIVWLSHSSTWVTGADPAARTGADSLERIHPDDVERLLYGLIQLKAAGPAGMPNAGVPHPLRYRFRRWDGEWIVMEATVHNLIDDPEVDGMLVFSRPVSGPAEGVGHIIELLALNAPLEDVLVGCASLVPDYLGVGAIVALVDGGPVVGAAPGVAQRLAVDDRWWRRPGDPVGVSAGADPTGAPRPAGLAGAAGVGVTGVGVTGAAGPTPTDGPTPAGGPTPADGTGAATTDGLEAADGGGTCPGVRAGFAGLPCELVEAAKDEGFRSVWVLPIHDRSSDGVIGWMVLWVRIDVEPVARDDVLVQIERLAALVIAEQRRRDALRLRAATDALTGMANRAALQDRLDAATGDVTLAILDLDDFKPVNDTYGHETGDEVLRIVAQRLQGVVRDGDLAVRYGGDEFAVVFAPGTPPAGAQASAQRVIEAIEAPIAVDGAPTLRVGASLGLSTASPSTVTQAADAALYAAKRTKSARTVGGPGPAAGAGPVRVPARAEPAG